MDKKQIKTLIKILGKEKVAYKKEFLITYSYDATQNQFLPEVVVFPKDSTDVKKIIDFAFLHKIPVVPRGAGVGFSGGCVPIKGGIVICFTKMNRILNIDEENLIAEVEPGVITYQLIQACEEKGLFYPPDPASLKTSTIGGNVAENAGGPRCFKYGVTGNYVLALEGYLSNGQKIVTGCHAIKNVAGYDLKSLLIGSEGTLAVITKISLRLINKPQERILIRIDLPSLKEGALLIQSVIKSGLSPSVLEFMDKTSIKAVYSYLNLDRHKNHNASVLMEIDGSRDETTSKKNTIQKLIKKIEILDIKFADSEKEQELIWSIRRNVSPALTKIRPKKINEDVAVPVKYIPQTVEFINQMAEDLNIPIILYGHFGDGNIHTNIMINPDDEREKKNASIALDKLFKYVIEKKGTISGEHGIGISKKDFMHYQFNQTQLELFKQIKGVFDPDNILNPGKIFD